MKTFYSLNRGFFKLLFSLLYHHKVYGTENLPKGAVIIAANHASYFDPPMIAASCPEEVHYLAKSSLFEIPILKTIIHQLNAYPVTGSANDLGSVKILFQLLRDEQKVVIFPEGLRTYNGHLSPIKSGIGMLALRSNCPIIPTYLHGTFDVWPRTRRFPKLYGRTACVFGEPIIPTPFFELEKKEAREAIAATVQGSIEKLKVWYKQNAFQK